MSIFAYNGGSVLAMMGKNCVAICADKRLGNNQLQTVDMGFEHIKVVNDRALLAMTGLVTDVQYLQKLFRFHHNLYNLRENRDMSPETLHAFLTHTVYSKRSRGGWFAESIVAGLKPDGTPYLNDVDVVGSPGMVDNYSAIGVARHGLIAMASKHWMPDMEAEDLFEMISQCFLAAIDRDILSGWGAVCYIMTPDKIIRRDILTRMD